MSAFLHVGDRVLLRDRPWRIRYVHPMPVPPAGSLKHIPAIPTRLAWQARIRHISEDRSVWPLLWQENRGVAEAYGLDPEDFSHILASFPGFARKRAGLVEYFNEQLDAWRAGKP